MSTRSAVSRLIAFRLIAIRFFITLTLALLGAATALAEVDPPGRIARLNYFDGEVTFAPAGTEQWGYATLNRPLTGGDRLWVAARGRAELHIGSTALRLDEQTSFEVLTLDDDTVQLELTQGSIAVHIREMWIGQSVEIDTPNLAFVVTRPGEFRISVDAARDTTTVAVRVGDGLAHGERDNSLRIRARQQIQFGGANLDELASGSVWTDRFDDWVAQRTRREDQSRSTRYVSRELTGYEDLDDNGDWREVAGYGPVWRPRVTVVGWAPYRYGHWTWVAPWGWTWIDDAAWGFAPFHYGRWAWIDGYWGWCPGPVVRRPVYAPALVVFAGGAGNLSWSISLSGGINAVAWFPLAPGEFYRPVYGASSLYFNNINHSVVIRDRHGRGGHHDGGGNGRRAHYDDGYANQRLGHAITAVPGNRFVSGERVGRDSVRVDPEQIRHARYATAPVLAPTERSLNSGGRRLETPPVITERQRQVVMRHRPEEPAALRDTLARTHFERGGVVANAGALPTHIATGRSERQERQSGEPRTETLRTTTEHERAGNRTGQRDEGRTPSTQTPARAIYTPVREIRNGDNESGQERLPTTVPRPPATRTERSDDDRRTHERWREAREEPTTVPVPPRNRDDRNHENRDRDAQERDPYEREGSRTPPILPPPRQDDRDNERWQNLRNEQTQQPRLMPPPTERMREMHNETPPPQFTPPREQMQPPVNTPRDEPRREQEQRIERQRDRRGESDDERGGNRR